MINEIEDVEVSDSLDKFLKLARDAHGEGESFLRAGLYNRWRRSYSMAQSEHPDDSKYHTEAFKHRSKSFRGKTEASIRKNEAAAAIAMFSSHDVVSIEAENRGDEGQMVVAGNVHKLVNSRLDKSIKWFMLAIGGYHEAMICGNICSEQYWEYEKNGDELIADHPVVNLYPSENVKVSPRADWLDPIHSSPYVILEVPMFIGDIKERMNDDWIEYGDSEIQRASATFDKEEIKTAREGREQTTAKSSAASSHKDFDVVFVHKNFIRTDGEDWFFYTLGTELMLSVPMLVHEAYPHLKKRKRPITWGTATIEPHKVHNRSLTERVSNTQIQSNEIANLRFDNVRQVLNKIKYVKRNVGVDYKALKNSVPGQTVLMDELDAVKTADTPDVTGSSYNEQNLLNADFDELAGSFSTSSVSTNRQLNETVGGMNLLSGNSNTLTEYQLRVFVETWIEEVVRQLTAMILFYEDDQVIQTVLGDPTVTHDSLQIPLSVRVSVGFGATDPQMKVQKLAFGIDMVSKLPGMAEQLNADAIAEEVFALTGHNDGRKFIKEDKGVDPMVQQLQQQVQELMQIIQTKQIEIEGNLAIEDKKGQNNIAAAVIKATSDRQIRLTELALSQGTKVQQIESTTGTNDRKFQLDIMKEYNRMRDVENKTKELEFKKRTGREGI